MNYERPTDELRQVKRPIWRGNGMLGPSYRETPIGYDTTVQRKWLIYDGQQEANAAGLIVWSQANPEGRKPREEWRDLPTVYPEKPQATAQ